MMKYIRAVLAITTFALLSACGGGGGSAGNTSGVALFTTAAEKITIAPNEVQTYNIGGGVAGYKATSSSGAASVSVNGKVLTITGGGGGAATITVTDASGARVLIEATVGSGVELFTTAPEKLTLGVGLTSTTFTIGGGSRIYSVTSGNRQVVTVAQNGSAYTLTGVAAGVTTVAVTDTLGGSKKIEVTIGSGLDLFTTAPSAVTVAVGASSAVYSIGGGSEVYSVSSNDSSVATVGQSNSKTFVITGKTGGKAVVIVKDSAGKEVKIDVVVGKVDALFSTAAADVTIDVGAGNTYKVGGGTTIYSVSSSNLSVAKAVITDNDLVITGVAVGKTVVIVRDSIGGTLSINVTVGSGVPLALFTTAASDIVVAPGTSPSFTIGGGRAPYLVSSSNASVLTASVSGGTLNLKGVLVGTAKVVIVDAAGANLTINATVGKGAVVPLFTTAASSITMAINAAATYGISGGTEPYTATSSNSGVATVDVSGASYVVTAKAVGTAQIVIRDSVGATVTVAVTVSSAAVSPLDVVPGDSTGAVGDTLNFAISGGTSPFTITNNNPSIATVTQTANNFTAKLINVGSTVVTIVDAQGLAKKITITVTATSSQLRISPSTLEIGEDNSNTYVLEVKGGTAPYRVFTSDLVKSSVSISGSSITVGLGSQGNRCIHPVDLSNVYQRGSTYLITVTALDSVGSTATSTLSIRDNSKGAGADNCGN
jgi:hypothetical protein